MIDRTTIGRKVLSPLFTGGVVAVILCLLVACGQSNQSSTPNPTPESSAIQPVANVANPAIPTLAATSTRNANCLVYIAETPNGDKDAAATRVKETDNCNATRFALTHAPMDTPGPPASSLPSSPEPLPMGVFTCDPRPGAPYLERSCWRGQIDNQAITVAAGRETLNLPDGDENQGVIEVYPGSDFGFNGLQGQEYNTPLEVGPVLISSVNGNSLTLIAADHGDPLNWFPLPGGATFTFDLATRQWTSWDCGISCTPTPAIGTPVLTTTPAH